jgi:Ca2+-binding EF-hand superfamily protein
MPIQSLEQGNNLENTNPIPPSERYMDIERGDNFNTTNSQLNQNSTQTQQTFPATTPPKQKPIDPVEVVKGLFSAGFTPTKAQIQSLQSQTDGPINLTDTWFKIFLQKLVRQNKKKQKKN